MSYKSLSALIVVLILSQLTFAQAPNATALVKAADLKLRGETSSNHLVNFEVYRPGQTAKRQMVVYLRGRKYSFTHFLKPLHDKNTTLLKRNYDLWMYTSKVRKTARIPFAMMHEGVLGSDFTYDDIVKESTFTDDYSHSLVGVSKTLSKQLKQKVYIVDLAPLPGRPVSYKKIRMWIRSSDENLARVQYYDDELKVTRVCTYRGIKNVGGRVIPTVWDMYNVRKGEQYHTIYRIVGAKYNDITDDSMFDMRSLTNPPAPEWDKTTTTVSAAVPNATDLVRTADLKLRGEKSSNHYVSFEVYRPNQTIKRKMVIYLRGRKFSFTHFVQPLRDKNTTMLKRDYDLWMYTPKVRKTVRIPFSMMHEGVLGSDFTYDDIVKEATLTDDYSHKIIGESKAMAKTHGKVYIVDLAPLPGRPVSYKKIRLWIRTQDGNMVRAQFYDDELKVTRVCTYSQFKNIGGRFIPTVWDMHNMRKKDHHTTYRLIGARYNDITNDEMFVMRSLTVPPAADWSEKATTETPTTAAPNATDLVRTADLKLRGEKSSNHYVSFEVYRPNQTIKRKMVIYLRGRKFSFTHFVQPLRDKNTTMLKRDYDLWMYTPKVRKTVRIPFSMMHEGVLGSDFTYDDIVKEATLTDDYSHKIIGESKAMAKTHGKVYILDLAPLPGRPVSYKKIRLWIRTKDGNMVRAQFYDDELKVTRVCTYSNFQQIGDRFIPTVWDMHNMRKKDHHTTYRLIGARYNDIENDEMFVMRSLTSPPADSWEK